MWSAGGELKLSSPLDDGTTDHISENKHYRNTSCVSILRTILLIRDVKKKPSPSLISPPTDPTAQPSPSNEAHTIYWPRVWLIVDGLTDKGAVSWADHFGSGSRVLCRVSWPARRSPLQNGIRRHVSITRGIPSKDDRHEKHLPGDRETDFSSSRSGIPVLVALYPTRIIFAVLWRPNLYTLSPTGINHWFPLCVGDRRGAETGEIPISSTDLHACISINGMTHLKPIKMVADRIHVQVSIQ